MSNSESSIEVKNEVQQSPLKNTIQNFKDFFTKIYEEKNTSTNSDEEVDYRIYGILWENYIKNDMKAKQALANYYQISVDKLAFAQSKDKPENYKNIFTSTNDIKSRIKTKFINKEKEKNKLVFDCYIKNRKIIIDMKLSSVKAIGLKDIAYMYYFPDHQLHFFFFTPINHTNNLNKYFKKRINDLVKKFNGCLELTAKKLEIKDIQEKTKLITRNDLMNFPLLTESLTVLEEYLPQPPYLCQECEKHEEFVSFSGLTSHIKRVHLKLKQKCDECEKSVLYGSLSDHKKIEHLKIKERCDECGREDIPYGKLTDHKKIEHLKLKEKCDECGREDIPYGKLSDHKKAMHLKLKVKCDECGREDILYGNLYTHKKMEHLKLKVKCDECGKEFPYRKFFDHKKKVHLKLKQKCDECGGEDIHYGKLNDNIKLDNQILNVKCDEFGKEVIYGNLSTHKKTNHQKLKVKCDECGKEIPYGKFSIHKKRNHQKIKQQCGLCYELVPYGDLYIHTKRKHKNANKI